GVGFDRPRGGAVHRGRVRPDAWHSDGGRHHFVFPRRTDVVRRQRRELQIVPGLHHSGDGADGGVFHFHRGRGIARAIPTRSIRQGNDAGQNGGRDFAHRHGPRQGVYRRGILERRERNARRIRPTRRSHRRRG